MLNCGAAGGYYRAHQISTRRRSALPQAGLLTSRRLQQYPRQGGARLLAKVVLDRVIAAAVLVLVAPLLVLVAGAVLVSMGPPVFFRQTRPGRGGRPFELLKLRTMGELVDGEGRPLADADRLTPLGRVLRATSVDELPQLWNVLRGDLSLVGPRPLLMQYLERYTPEQSRRHEVLPGITGWAQINGRNTLTWEERFALDVWYVDNWSLALDLRIIALTLGRVVRRTGIAREGHATMPEFLGNSDATQERLP